MPRIHLTDTYRYHRLSTFHAFLQVTYCVHTATCTATLLRFGLCWRW